MRKIEACKKQSFLCVKIYDFDRFFAPFEISDFEVEENLNPSKPMVWGLLKIVDFQCAKHEMFERHKNVVFASFD